MAARLEVSTDRSEPASFVLPYGVQADRAHVVHDHVVQVAGDRAALLGDRFGDRRRRVPSLHLRTFLQLGEVGAASRGVPADEPRQQRCLRHHEQRVRQAGAHEERAAEETGREHAERRPRRSAAQPGSRAVTGDQLPGVVGVDPQARREEDDHRNGRLRHRDPAGQPRGTGQQRVDRQGHHEHTCRHPRRIAVEQHETGIGDHAHGRDQSRLVLQGQLDRIHRSCILPDPHPENLPFRRGRTSPVRGTRFPSRQ
jgi:hypothetical protein